MNTGRWMADAQRWLSSGPRWRAWAVVGGGLAGLAWFGWEAAAGLGGAAQSTAADPLSSGTLVLDVFVKLGLVIALIYGALFAWRRWQGGPAAVRGLFAAPQRQLTLLETTRLSPRQALHLVRVGGQTWLIGATDQGIALLAEVEPAEVSPRPAASVPPFAATLNRALTGAAPAEPAEAAL